MSIAKCQLSSIQASYGKTLGVAIDDLSLSAGGLYVLVGPNGSGKTTCINVISGLF